MSSIQSKTIKGQIGQAPESLVVGIRSFLNGVSPMSIIDCDMLTDKDQVGNAIIEFTCQYRTGGAATYGAMVLSYNPTLGTTFDAQVAEYFSVNAATVFPRAFFDVSSRTTRGLNEKVLAIHEITTATGFVLGDQEFKSKRGYIAEANEEIAVGATGSIDLYSPSGRTKTTTATNKGPLAISSGDRIYVFYDYISQQLWAISRCPCQ